MPRRYLLPTIAFVIVIALGFVSSLIGNIVANELGRYFGNFHWLALVIIAVVIAATAAILQRWLDNPTYSEPLGTGKPPVRDFIGRKSQIKELLPRLQPRRDRAVIGVVWGGSGVGKTEFARSIVREPEIRRLYPNGFIELDMHGVDPSDSPRKVEEALKECLAELRVPADRYQYKRVDGLVSLYQQELQKKRLIIILDDLDEQIERWQELLFSDAKRCAFLITSQTSFDLRPHPSYMLELEPFYPKEARQFLIDLAKYESKFPFEISNEVAGEICKLCDYLPLTIRAAWNMMKNADPIQAPEEFLKDLRREPGKITRLGHRDLNSVISMNYDRLSPQLQQALQHLTVFQSSFDDRAAQIVLHDFEEDVVDKLEHRSLLLHNERTGRYQLQTIVRDTVRKKVDPNELRAIQVRAGARYACYAKQLVRQASKDSSLLPAERVRDLRIALRVCDELASLGVRLPASQVLGDGAHADRLRQAPGRVIRLFVLRALGDTYDSAGDYKTEAIQYFQEALTLAESYHLNQVCASILYDIGSVYTEQGNYDQSIGYYEKALYIAREYGFDLIMVRLLGGIGRAYNNKQEYNNALEYYEEMIRTLFKSELITIDPNNKIAFKNLLKSMRRFSDIFLIADVMANLGMVHANLNKHTEANKYLEPALELSRTFHLRDLQSKILRTIGHIQLDAGNLQDALIYFQESLNIEGGYLNRLETIRFLGLVHYRLGNEKKAKFYFQYGLEVAREMGGDHDEGRMLMHLGEISVNGNDAIEYFSNALQIFRRLRLKEEGRVLYDLARAYAQIGDLETARSCATSAIKQIQAMEEDDQVSTEVIKTAQSLIQKIDEARSAEQSPQSLSHIIGLVVQALPRRPSDQQTEQQIQRQLELLDHISSLDRASELGMAPYHDELARLYEYREDWDRALVHAQKAATLYEHEYRQQLDQHQVVGNLVEADEQRFAATQNALDNFTIARLHLERIQAKHHPKNNLEVEEDEE